MLEPHIPHDPMLGTRNLCDLSRQPRPPLFQTFTWSPSAVPTCDGNRHGWATSCSASDSRLDPGSQVPPEPRQQWGHRVLSVRGER